MAYIDEPKELNLKIWDGVNFGIDLSSITVAGSLFDFTGYTITMNIAEGRRKTTSEAVLSFTGNDWTVGNGSLNLEVAAADVDIAAGVYYYDIIADDGSGEVVIVAYGKIEAFDVLGN